MQAAVLHGARDGSLSEFEQRARVCKSKNKHLDKLSQFHIEKTKKQFNDALQHAGYEYQQEAMIKIDHILTHHLSGDHQSVVSPPGAYSHNLGRPSLPQPRGHKRRHTADEDNDDTATFWGDKDMRRAARHMPGPRSAGTLR